MADNNPDTIGVEFEGVTQTRGTVSHILSYLGSNISVTRDASVESVTRMVTDNLSIFMGSSLLRTNLMTSRNDEVVAGYEIVTIPLKRDEMKSVTNKVLAGLRKGGEIFSPRASIHFHIGFPQGYVFLKNAVAMGLKIEPLFYKLAGMGRPYRGEINHSAFARPLRSPPAVKMSSGSGYLVLNPEDSINAEDTTGFWGRFGIKPADSGRYVPLRYFAINLYSVLIRSTMEYRFFNYSDVSRHVTAVGELCQCVSDLMLRAPLSTINSMNDVSIFKENNITEYTGLLDNVIRLSKYYNSPYGISPEAEEAIYELLETTPQPVFTKDVVKTHLETYSLPSRDWPFLRKEKTVIDAGVTNIHNFTQSNSSLL